MSRHVCDVMCWVKRSELSCGRTVLQYCCCLIAILTAWKQFLKISHREGSTRVKIDRDVTCLPAHDVTVIIFAMFKMCYEHFYNLKRLYSSYLSEILWYKRNFFFFANVLWSDRFKMGVTSHLLSRWLYFVLTNQFLQ